MKYGRTDPSSFQLRDLHRRVTRQEAAYERLIVRQTKIMETINDILSGIEGYPGLAELVEASNDHELKFDVLEGRLDRVRRALHKQGISVN